MSIKNNHFSLSFKTIVTTPQVPEKHPIHSQGSKPKTNEPKSEGLHINHKPHVEISSTDMANDLVRKI